MRSNGTLEVFLADSELSYQFTSSGENPKRIMLLAYLENWPSAYTVTGERVPSVRDTPQKS